MSTISPAHREQINELRRRVGVDLLLEHPTYDTDFDMLRWLQGYDFDVDAIVPKLRSHLALRKLWRMDSAADEYTPPNEVAAKCVFFGWLPTPLSVDEYCGVSIDCFGRIDCEGLVRSVSLTQVYKRFVWGCEKSMRAIRERERLTGKQSWVVEVEDLEGLRYFDPSFLSFMGGAYKAFTRFIVSHYVEMLKKVVLVNAPAVIYYFWNYVVSPLLPAKTRDKVVILGSNWREEIVNHVDASALPVYFGGTVVDDDGNEMALKKAQLIVPCKVPTEFYWSKHEDSRYTKLETISIPAGKCRKVVVRASAGDRLGWIVFCESDYVFSIDFSPSTDQNNNSRSTAGFYGIVESKHAKRVEDDDDVMICSDLEIAGNKWLPEEDAIACEQCGDYKLSFRNEAWFGRCTVRYAIFLNENLLHNVETHS